MAALVLWLGAGRLLTWLLQVNGLTARIWSSHPVLSELAECDLCLGFWVFLALAPDDDLGFRPRLFNRVVLAGAASLLMHLARIGWDTKFGVNYLGGEDAVQ